MEEEFLLPEDSLRFILFSPFFILHFLRVSFRLPPWSPSASWPEFRAILLRNPSFLLLHALRDRQEFLQFQIQLRHHFDRERCEILF